jgi:hypothetical protein
LIASFKTHHRDIRIISRFHFVFIAWISIECGRQRAPDSMHMAVSDSADDFPCAEDPNGGFQINRLAKHRLIAVKYMTAQSVLFRTGIDDVLTFHATDK